MIVGRWVHVAGFILRLSSRFARSSQIRISLASLCANLGVSIMGVPTNSWLVCFMENPMKNTSSTAQGGGGSFQNRKPIGEVGCCESWMAEQIH